MKRPLKFRKIIIKTGAGGRPCACRAGGSLRSSQGRSCSLAPILDRTAGDAVPSGQGVQSAVPSGQGVQAAAPLGQEVQSAVPSWQGVQAAPCSIVAKLCERCPQGMRRCRAASKRRIPAAMAAFRDSVAPAMGMMVFSSAASAVFSESPLPSLPMRKAVPCVRGRAS